VSPDFAEVTPTVILTFLEGNGKLSPATRRRRFATLCTFYRWLLRQELVTTNPMERLDPIKPTEREPRPLADETVQAILKAIPPARTRDRALFTLVYETGMRIGDYIG